jgi:pyruvate kinase
LRRTKIVCTIGPASDSAEKIKELLAAGMDVARLNFSHGTQEEHRIRIAVLKEEAQKADKFLAIILDTKGPEIRTGMVPKEGILLQNGAFFNLDLSSELGTLDRVGITYSNLWQEVEPGNHILIDDGQFDLEVTKVQENVISTLVRNGGILKSQKGVNVPGVKIRLPAVTQKDIEDIRFGISQGIDFIAASFTRKAEDILAVRSIVEDEGGKVQIIAKIENREGLENLEAILEVSDGIMVARGDLGVEIPVEEVPCYQKEIIRKCNLCGKPVIVATQMLESMIRQPRPTRAEASDVANAILDGTDAIMLSGETAEGRFPIESVKLMDKIARKTESQYLETKSVRHPHLNVAEAISYASYTIANDLDATAIITPTHSGSTARMISKYRPKALIIAATPFSAIARTLSLQWGVKAILITPYNGTDQLLSTVVNTALNKNLIQVGKIVVITAGVPVGTIGSTNLIKVQIVGNALIKGIGIGRNSYTGPVRKISAPEKDRFDDGDILVSSTINAAYIPLISRAGAILIEESRLSSDAVITSLQYDIPVIVGAYGISTKISEGQIITVDALAGVIYDGAVSIL